MLDNILFGLFIALSIIFGIAFIYAFIFKHGRDL